MMTEAQEWASRIGLDRLYVAAATSSAVELSILYREAAVNELIRRAKEMEQRLSPKEAGHEPMPSPVEVWLVISRGKTLFYGSKPAFSPGESYGPYQITPGMMSLDELAKHGLMIQPVNDAGPPWGIFTPEKKLDGDYGTSAEAQWEATQLAKKKIAAHE